MYETHTIDGYVVPVFFIKTKKKTETVFAICKDCDAKFEKFAAPWPMTKSMGLHTYGLGHTNFLLFKVQNDEKLQDRASA